MEKATVTPKQHRLLIVTGLYDLEKAGNQTLRRTIEGYRRASWRVDMFSFMPGDYPNLIPPDALGPEVRIKRLPAFLDPLLRAGAALRDRLGRARRMGAASSQEVEYYGEFNWFGRAVYLVFLYLVLAPIQALRIFWHAIRSRPDIIYGLNCHGAIVASLVGPLFRIPVVTRFYGVGITQSDLCSLRRRLWNLDEVSGVKAKSDLLIMTNDGTRGADVARKLGHQQSEILFLMNGLELGGRSKEDALKGGAVARRSADDDLHLLMLSRLARWKRVDRGIRALAQVASSLRSRVTLTIVGDGPERPALEQLAKDLQVADRVHFAGAVSHSETSKYYSSAHAFLSLYDVSNLGNPVIEALSFGLPIITLADASTDDLLRNEFNALLVPKGDLDTQLPEAIQRLAFDLLLWSALSDGARKTFRTDVWTWAERMEVELRAVERLQGATRT